MRRFVDYSTTGPTLKDLRCWLTSKYVWFAEESPARKRMLHASVGS